MGVRGWALGLRLQTLAWAPTSVESTRRTAPLDPRARLWRWEEGGRWRDGSAQALVRGLQWSEKDIFLGRRSERVAAWNHKASLYKGQTVGAVGGCSQPCRVREPPCPL